MSCAFDSDVQACYEKETWNVPGGWKHAAPGHAQKPGRIQGVLSFGSVIAHADLHQIKFRAVAYGSLAACRRILNKLKHHEGFNRNGEGALDTEL